MDRLVDYEQDLYAWFSQNATLLREGRLAEIDLVHIADELEDMGISQLRALESRLTVLLMHLLKWQYQPIRRSKSWSNTIIEQRKQISKLLKRSPSLQHHLAESIADAYDSARRYAETETGLSINTFPEDCPYLWEKFMESDFFPDG